MNLQSGKMRFWEKESEEIPIMWLQHDEKLYRAENNRKFQSAGLEPVKKFYAG